MVTIFRLTDYYERKHAVDDPHVSIQRTPKNSLKLYTCKYQMLQETFEEDKEARIEM